MNHTAVVNGTEYRLIETIPGLDSLDYVLCQDTAGQRFVCQRQQWKAAAPPPLTRIHAKSAAEEKIKLFMELFHGRDDVYARRWYNRKTQKSGYAPACRNEWAPGICNKKKFRCADCPNREFVPLSPEAVRAHLIGRDGDCRDVAGIYPLLPDDTTRLLCVDFDDAGWQEDIRAFRETAQAFGLTPAVERSRSGEGGHGWFFFEKPVSAADARKLGSLLLTRAMEKRHEKRTRSS